MNLKKLTRIEKILGQETIQEIVAKPHEEVRAMIIAAETAIQEAEDELHANPNYQELKENLKALTAGLREVKQRQRAIIDFSVYTLNPNAQE
jgi:vancomycin permeability regulator SanA